MSMPVSAAWAKKLISLDKVAIMQKCPVLSPWTTVIRLRWFSVPLFLSLVFLLSGLTACTTPGIFSGGSWQAGSLQSEHIQVLAVDPNHSRNIYAGDTQDGVFVSTDAGFTWKKGGVGLPLPVTIYALSFDIPGERLYAANTAGLFVSTNSAQSWSPVNGLPPDSYTALAFDVNSPHTIYVGSARSGVLESTNDGAGWTAISNGLPERSAITSLLYDPNLKQLWVAYTNALYRSADQGASWQIMDSGMSANAGINALALGDVTSGDGSLIFAGTNHGFFRSTDAGQHWAQSQSSLANLHIHAILTDATQANVVYASTQIGVLRSQDSGQNWEQVASGLPSGQFINGLVQGGDSYAQLLVAAHGIYLYPGTGSVFDPSRLIPLILILLFFVILYRFLVVRRRKSRRIAINTANK
jgi:photosystem II stability/assembly factor-like uncharacterized protein